MKRLSVILPVYNAEKYIQQCLETIVKQTYANLEIIIINDGSTDSSEKIIKQFKSKNILYISQKNQGIGYTRNKGIALATGDYIAFVDADDYLELDMYEKMINQLESEEADIVVCDYFEERKTQSIHRIKPFSTTSLVDNPTLINAVNTAPWNKVYKKELFDNISYSTTLKYEDLSTTLIAMLKANKIAQLEEPLYHYYINEVGETSSYDYKVVDVLKQMEIVMNAFPKTKEMQRELRNLSYDKVYPYIIALYDTQDLGTMSRFVNASFEYMNKHFLHWKLFYICKSKNPKDFLIRCMQVRKKALIRFIKKRVPKTKKTVLLTNYSLHIGGVEKALANLANSFDFDKYDVTVFLQHREGPFIEQLDRRINIEDFHLSKLRFSLLRKAINMVKIEKVILENKNKYDFSAAFGTGYEASARLALKASKNNAAWMHTNIYNYIKNKLNLTSHEEIVYEIKKFLNGVYFDSFKQLLFVSDNAMNAFLEIFPEKKEKCCVCRNMIDYKDIYKNAEIKISEKKHANCLNIVNISRHTEYDKKLSRIIEAVKIIENKVPIHVFMIGDGTDHQQYVDLVKKNKLEDKIEFLGSKSNPFPYYLLGDVSLLCSDFEGFPTTYTESLTLGIPIITTDVSDANSFIQNQYGLVCKKEAKSLAKTIEKFYKEKYKMEKRFDPAEYNKESLKIIESMIENEGIINNCSGL